jgi:hypothetical protein
MNGKVAKRLRKLSEKKINVSGNIVTYQLLKKLYKNKAVGLKKAR